MICDPPDNPNPGQEVFDSVSQVLAKIPVENMIVALPGAFKACVREFAALAIYHKSTLTDTPFTDAEFQRKYCILRDKIGDDLLVMLGKHWASIVEDNDIP